MDNVVQLAAYGYEAEILPSRGANLISLGHPGLGVQALRSPRSLADFTASNPYLYGIPVLFPPNRISGARFTFEGREYVFPMNEPEIGNFLHGTIHETPFACVWQSKAGAEFVYEATGARPYMTFPHAFSMSIRYDLSPAGMRQRIAITNLSGENMPVALGFHTTFRLPFARDGGDIRLMLDVNREYLRDMTTFLPDGQARDAFDIKEALLGGGIAPGDYTISRHFSMGDQRRMRLADVRTGVEIVYTADSNYRYWMVYNGGIRDFICVEPQTWLNNCPNAPFPRQETGFAYLRPGEGRTYETALAIGRIAQR